MHLDMPNVGDAVSEAVMNAITTLPASAAWCRPPEDCWRGGVRQSWSPNSLTRPFGEMKSRNAFASAINSRTAGGGTGIRCV